MKATVMWDTFKNIALLCTFNLYAKLTIVTAISTSSKKRPQAGSLRATVRLKVQQENNGLREGATAFQDTETLKLTDDDSIDSIAFLRDEVEHGYLDRKRWDIALLASQEYKDDDDAQVLDDDQFRDPATGGFLPVEDQ